MYGVMRKSCSIAGRSLKYIWKYGVGFNDTVNHLNAYDNICAGCGYFTTYRKKSNSFHLYLLDSILINKASTNNGHSEIFLPSGKTIEKVTCGRSHIIILTNDKTVYSYGINSLGQCGNTNSTDELSLSSVNVATCLINEVVCGLDHTLFLTESGKVFACGWSGDGQTGTGCSKIVWKPLPVKGDINEHNIVKLFSGADSNFALTDQHLLYAWGNNEYGQLKFENKIPQITIPTLISTDTFDSPISDIAVGGPFTVFLTESGITKACGYGLTKTNGKLHHLTSNVKSIQSGLHYCVTISSDNKLIIWGTPPTNSRHSIPKNILHLSCGPDEIYGVVRC